jgi:succinate dehydrogenase / fumarate reductase membrane anchor subunit
VVAPRVTTTAHYGLRDWLSQRLTAVVMAVYTLLWIVILFRAAPDGGLDFAGWQALFASGTFRVLTFLFLACLYWHAWVGMRNILMDYVKPTGLRLALQAVVIAVLVAYTGWAVQILWGAH